MEEATPINIEMFHHRLKVILAIVLFCSVFAFKYTSGTEPSCHQKAPSRMDTSEYLTRRVKCLFLYMSFVIVSVTRTTCLDGLKSCKNNQDRIVVSF